MNTQETVTLASTSAEQTERIAERLGRNLRGGEMIELASDLGGGKTTFVRGLARGFGSSDRVASPTFTISKVYTAGDRQLYHFDFYRLSDPGLVALELSDVLQEPQSVVVVEWAGIVHQALPDERLTIHITRTGEDSRQLECRVPASLRYVLEGVTV